MLVTINTDASFHSKLKVGAYAFWISSNDGRIFHAGHLKGKPCNPDEAELMCIINAMYALFEKSGWKNVSKVIINTDSMNSIHTITNDRDSIVKYRVKDTIFKTYRKRFKGIIKRHSFSGTIEFRHVKSHSGTKEARKWVNDWCDTQAKKALWDYINSLEKAQ